jgi:hypothetical protein
MKSKLILSSSIKLAWLFRFSEIYGRESFLNDSCKHKITVEEDLFSASDYRKCDHEASCIEENMLATLIDNRRIGFLTKWGGDVYAKFFVGKQVIKEAKLVFLSFRYAEKVHTQYNIQGHAYIWANNFSWKIYKEIRRMGLLPNEIKIHPVSAAYIRLHGTVKFLYFFIISIFYLEISSLRMRGRQISCKPNYQSIVHLDKGLLGGQPIIDGSIADNKIFRLFSKDASLFVSGGFNNQVQGWEEEVRNIGYDVFQMDDVFKTTSMLHFIFRYYPHQFMWRARLIILSLLYPWLMVSCYRALRLRVLWELFYDKISGMNLVCMMIEENITSSVVHKKNMTKSIFTYFSTTESIVGSIVKNNISSCHDYTHMIADYVVSSSISNNWIRTHQNEIGQYIPLGPIFSDIVFETNNNRSSIRNKLGISNDVNVVSFFDHTIGNYGVLTITAYNAFLRSMLKLARDNKGVTFIYKSKKLLPQIGAMAGAESLQIIEMIRSEKNCIYANDVISDSLTLIGVSDLVVSAPLSSVIFESLCGGVKTISYDPMDQYGRYDVVSQKLPRIAASNFDQLELLIKYWLYDCSNEEYKEFLAQYVSLDLDGKCNGSAISRYRSLLESNA